MSLDPIPLTIKLEEGPVAIKNHFGEEIRAKYELWEEMTVSEYFPPNVSSANYVLEIEKLLMDPDEVQGAQDLLIEALHYLAYSWPFCGGSHLILHTEEFQNIPK